MLTKIVKARFIIWDKIYDFLLNSLDLKMNDKIIVETSLGIDLAQVVDIIELDLEEEKIAELTSVLHLATKEELSQAADEKKKDRALEICRNLIKKDDLPMKLVDVHFSLDNRHVNFAFISNNRVDFRSLVRDLASHFKANIRLTQIGSRDEARLMGDCSHCGRQLCCQCNIKEFNSITSEMAEVQQVVHRGSDRISGMCGRLMCCLSYEYEDYKDKLGKLPPIGTKVNVDGSRGVVIAHHVLKEVVDVRLTGTGKGKSGVVISVDINRHRKNKK